MLDRNLIYSPRTYINPLPDLEDQLTPNVEGYDDQTFFCVDVRAGYGIATALIEIARVMAGRDAVPLTDTLFNAIQMITQLLTVLKATSAETTLVDYLSLLHGRMLVLAMPHLQEPWCYDVLAMYILKTILALYYQLRFHLNGKWVMIKPNIFAAELTGFKDMPRDIQIKEPLLPFAAFVRSNQQAIQRHCSGIAAEVYQLFVETYDESGSVQEPALSSFFNKTGATLFSLFTESIRTG